MRAYVVADDAIPEQAPASGSMVTHRHASRHMTRAERKKTHYYGKVLKEVVPDKLILRTGWGMGDTYALVELAPMLGHGHLDPGAINSYYSRGSVLLQDTSYPVRFPRYHNSFVLQPADRPDWWQGWKGLHEEAATTWRPMTIRVAAFHTSASYAYAHLRMERYLGQAVTVHREILFLGPYGLWVRDTLEAGAKGFRGRVGPAWQATHVYGKLTRRWANIAQVTLPIANTQKPDFVLQWDNRPMDLLVAFPVAVPGAEMSVDDVTDTCWIPLDRKGKKVQNTLARRVWYRKQVTLSPNQTQAFHSVLLPHPPTPDATPLADGIHALVHDGRKALLKLTLPHGLTLWAGMNPTRHPLTAGPLTTTAPAFLLLTHGPTVRDRWEATD